MRFHAGSVERIMYVHALKESSDKMKMDSCSKEQTSTHSGTHGYQYGYGS